MATQVTLNSGSVDSAGSLALKTNGTTTAVTINASQGVEFNAGSASTPSITTTGDTNTGIFFPAADTIAFSEGGVEAMRIDSAGNMGLGVTPSATASPFKALQVGAGAVMLGRSDGTVTSGQFGTNFYYNGTNDVFIGSGYATRHLQNNGVHRFEVSTASGTAGNAISFTQAMTLLTTGELMVGATNDGGKLTLSGTAGFAGNGISIFETSSGNGARLRISQNAGAVVYNATYSVGGNAHTWQIGNAEAARIDSNLNLLVGNTSGFGARIHAVTSSSSGCISTSATASSGTRYHIVFYENTTERGSITSSGGGVVYNSVSDYRLKENVNPMTGALAKVAQLNPVTYTWKDSESAGEGFIAHELQAVCPAAVTGDKDAVDEKGNPKYQGIDTSVLVATLTAAIQELKALIDTQASTITQLQADVAALKGTA